MAPKGASKRNGALSGAVLVSAVLEAAIAEPFEGPKSSAGARRNLSGNALDDVTAGRILAGRKAVKSGLIGALIGEQVALDYIESVTTMIRGVLLEDWELGAPEPWFNGVLSILLGVSPPVGHFSASESTQLYSITC